MTALHQIETKLSQTSLTLRALVFSMETIMVIKAKNLQDAEELLHSGINKVELAYDIGSDDFFRLASRWCDRGARITKGHQHFVVQIKGMAIPPNN
jgi:hypothetical protein